VAVSFYLDASALVALLSDDLLHTRADRFFRENPEVLLVSDFAAAEFSSVVARRVRVGAITTAEARSGFATFDTWCANSATRMEIIAADLGAAERHLRRLDTSLRAPDAIHIAIAQRLEATLVTFDRQMADNARALGTAVATP
jgi:hypothetical protein